MCRLYPRASRLPRLISPLDRLKELPGPTMATHTPLFRYFFTRIRMDLDRFPFPFGAVDCSAALVGAAALLIAMRIALFFTDFVKAARVFSGSMVNFTLTDEQKKQVAELQKDVDAKLDNFLTAEQKKHL